MRVMARLRGDDHGSWWARNLSPCVAGNWAKSGVKVLWLGHRCVSVLSRRYDHKDRVRVRKETEAALYDVAEREEIDETLGIYHALHGGAQYPETCGFCRRDAGLDND